jgi:hypothetical protein
MENHRTDSIPNDSYPVKSDRLLGVRFQIVCPVSDPPGPKYADAPKKHNAA